MNIFFIQEKSEDSKSRNSFSFLDNKDADQYLDDAGETTLDELEMVNNSPIII